MTQDLILNRWRAVATYRTVTGPVDVPHDVEEIEDLHDLIERGPHWDTIEQIVITRANICEPGLTVEAAAEL